MALMPSSPGATQVRDAVAVIQYLLWLEKMVPQGLVDEFSGAQHIDALRKSVLPLCPAPSSAWHRAAGPLPTISLRAAFQGAAAQPWTQLPVHLCQRAQRSIGTLQVWPGQGWGCQGGWEVGSFDSPPHHAHALAAPPTGPAGGCLWMRCTWQTRGDNICE